MVEKRSTKFMGLKNERIKLLIVILILLSSLMVVASPGNTSPIADCGPVKLNCQKINTPVQFNASASYDQNGSILSYEWDFGDGTTGTGVAPNHTYTSYMWNGSAYLPFIVNLKVTNNLGVSNFTSQQVTIWLAGDANGDGVVNILDASVVGLKWNSNDECADLNNDGKVNILDASIIGLNWMRKALDNTPPAGVTFLTDVSSAKNYINWTWTDPADADFATVSVWIDGEFKSSVPKGKQFYEATGFVADSEHTISTRTTDAIGNLNQTWVNKTARTAQAIELPPDPITVASPVDTTVATTIATSTSFLYTGSDPIQTGVANGTIEVMRAAVLRGRVLTREGTNLSGVNITILSHPEFGSTMTRADGMFDMAVNGGGLLTVNYEKTGYLTAQRQVNAPWQDYAWLPNIVMIQADPLVTSIDLSSSAPIQVAQGSVVTDSDGTRQATLLFPQGIQANMTLPDGTTQPLTTLHVRATEYTVGENGPEAMPAQLPPTTGYTYAVDLTVDEAMASGAIDVSFDKPVYTYVDNFLNFPVGGIVPVGYYNRSLGQWIPSDNGLIIKILGITGGMADLDVNGSNKTANASQLDALNITDAEREQLAGLYQQNQTLWRVPIIHFSPWDLNWPYGLPSGATSPNQQPPNHNNPLVNDPDNTCGSIIECQNQVLGEIVDIAGTPFTLSYKSDRVPGYKNKLDIQLSGTSLPANLKRIDLNILIGGRILAQSFPAKSNQNYTFTWDGIDAYGRTLQGAQPITVRIGYVYEAVYLTPVQLGSAFNAFGDLLTSIRARQELIIWQEWKDKMISHGKNMQSIGGWSLNIHQSYTGDFDRIRSKVFGTIITTAAGNGPSYYVNGDGGPATQAKIGYPDAVAVGPDSSFYIASNNRIRRVSTDGIITTVAGNGLVYNDGVLGDGGPAINASLNGPLGVAIGQDGSILIVDNNDGGFTPFNHSRIRRVGTDGLITTVAGNGNSSYSGDGGPATHAGFDPYGVAIGPDGSIYIADHKNNRIRKVGTDGIITTVAGNGIRGFSGDDGPAAQARINLPYGVAVGPDGSIYIADTGNLRIRRVGIDGIITTVAGNGIMAASGDGGPATKAGLYPYGVAVGQDGALYINEYYANKIRRVGPEGIITTIAGNGNNSYSGDGGPATQAGINGPRGVAVGQDGSIYVAEFYGRIRRLVSILPGFSAGDAPFIISSDDSSEIYLFSNVGRHILTMDAITGALRYQFAYDTSGRLINVTDSDNNTLTIERDSSGNATAIVSPYGQRTRLTMDANGYLASITNLAGESQQFNYTEDGLLTKMKDQRGYDHLFSYDAMGRLIKDEDPAGGFKTLERIEMTNGYSVKLGTGLGHITNYSVERLTTGDQKMVNTFPNGLKSETIIGINGSETHRYQDGTRISLLHGPDPRFGMMSPVLTNLTVNTPGGITQTTISERTSVLNNSNDPLSLKLLTENTKINGRVYTKIFNSTSKNIVIKTPLGRNIISTLDNKSHIIKEEVSGRIPVQYAYDDRGRLSNVTQGSHSYIYRYDGNGNLVSISDPLSHTTNYEYDNVGRIIKRISPDGHQIQYIYNSDGTIASITPPGRPDHVFNYTEIGLVKDYVPPDVGEGTTQTHFAYNIDRQLIKIARPDGAAIDISYDSARRPTTITQSFGIINIAYDPTTGNLKSITATDGGVLAYIYDGYVLTDINWSGIVSGNIHHTYDNNVRIISESINGGNNVSFQYDLDGRITSAGLLNLSRDSNTSLLTGATLGNITVSFGYNSFGEVISYQTASSSANILVINFTRDDIGRIIQKNETINNTSHTYTYTYDLAGHLTNVSKDGILVSQYIYDANGNRLNYTSTSGTIIGTYDNQDRLIRYGTTTYKYTANGELLSKTNGIKTTIYQYDGMGNLLNVTLTDGTHIEYIIDGQNRRIGKKFNGLLVQGFIYNDQLRPIAELDGANNMVSRFVYANRNNVPDYMIKGGNSYRIITDTLGSPRLIIDIVTGVIIQRMDYDEFGNIVFDTNPGFQPFGFAGGIYDRDIKFVRFGARDYDAEIGRWTVKDPILFSGGNPNLYGYVNNDPINYRDPSGLQSIDERERSVDRCWNRCNEDFWECVDMMCLGGAVAAIESGNVLAGLLTADIGSFQCVRTRNTCLMRCIDDAYPEAQS